MRVISGKARGTKLKAPTEEMPVRPTGDRVKEALFSAIQFDIHGNVLDLFAGSGQLGIEALSRGADFATFCDHDQRSVDLVTYNVEHTHFSDKSEILLTDYKKYLKHTCQKKFDLVFIDPPYGTGLADKALEYLSDGALLSGDAIVFVECPSEEKKPDRIGVLALQKRYENFCNVAFVIYRRAEGTV